MRLRFIHGFKNIWYFLRNASTNHISAFQSSIFLGFRRRSPATTAIRRCLETVPLPQALAQPHVYISRLVCVENCVLHGLMIVIRDVCNHSFMEIRRLVTISEPRNNGTLFTVQHKHSFKLTFATMVSALLSVLSGWPMLWCPRRLGQLVTMTSFVLMVLFRPGYFQVSISSCARYEWAYHSNNPAPVTCWMWWSSPLLCVLTRNFRPTESELPIIMYCLEGCTCSNIPTNWLCDAAFVFTASCVQS